MKKFVIIVSVMLFMLAGCQKEKENVMLFSVKDKTELSNLAEELLINKTKQRQIAENAYEEFKAKHSWDKRTQQFLEIIKRSRQ